MTAKSKKAVFAGPIRVSPDHCGFVNAAGEPFFWLGDTAWPLFAEYTRAEAERYLSDRAARGFTVIQGVLAWGGGTGFEAKAPGPNYAGDLPWLAGPAEPNPCYFEHVDRLVAFAADQGLVLAILPTWGYYVNDVGTIDEAGALAYGRWLGERYRSAPNIIWVNGGDRIGTGFESVYRALAAGLRAGDSGAHLIAYHPCGWRSSSQYFRSDDWLDITMIQTWTDWPKVHPAVTADCLQLPRRPVVLAEGAYENGPEYPLGPITPLVVRRQAWWAFTAGGFFTFGQDRIWRMGPGWDETFDTPGTRQMTIFRRVAGGRNWWNAMPDQGVFDVGVGSERTLNSAIRGVEGDWALVYLASQCHVRLNLDAIAARRARATWIDPRSGEPVDAGIFETGNLNGGVFPTSNKVWFSTPAFWEDAVLLLDATE